MTGGKHLQRDLEPGGGVEMDREVERVGEGIGVAQMIFQCASLTGTTDRRDWRINAKSAKRSSPISGIATRNCPSSEFIG